MTGDVRTPVLHPRASWIDPATGAPLAASELMAMMARRQAVLLGETHTVA